MHFAALSFTGRKPATFPRLWRAYQPTSVTQLAERLGLPPRRTDRPTPVSRFAAALCFTTVTLLATPGAMKPLAVDSASPRVGAASGAGTVLGSGVELAAKRPEPIGRRYRVVFVDKFKKLRRSVWDNREWWNTAPPRRSQYVRNGILHLVSRRSQGYPSHIAVTTFSSRKIFKFGYFEARMKWTKGNGSWPGFWLMSNAWARGGGDCSRPARAAEIDVFEGYGNHPRVFTGTIHRHSATHVCPSPSDAINSNNWQPQRVDLTRRFHRYAMKWTPARVTWYLDQRKVMSWPVYGTTNTRMFLLLSMYTGGESSPDSSSPAELHTKVDWVRVWQKG
jgi:beta-glucanase (GH16 family)